MIAALAKVSAIGTPFAEKARQHVLFQLGLGMIITRQRERFRPGAPYSKCSFPTDFRQLCHARSRGTTTHVSMDSCYVFAFASKTHTASTKYYKHLPCKRSNRWYLLHSTTYLDCEKGISANAAP